MNYLINFIKESDVEEVQDFIDREWKNGHILSTSKDLFNWQYSNEDGSYDFIITKHGNTIVGVLGFIQTAKYDKNLINNNVIWLALWKVSKQIKVTGIGLRMLSFLKSRVNHVAIAVNGINTAHPPLYKSLGYISAELNHYYVTNNDSNLKIVLSPKGYIHPKVNKMGEIWELVSKNNINNINIKLFSYKDSNKSIKKTPNYFLNRYLKHPFYKYQVYLIYGIPPQEAALIALRFDEVNGSNVLRIIDFLGNPEILTHAGKGLQKIMIENKVEYADFWSYGISDEIMKKLGFKKVKEDESIIVPTYFEPFIKSNGSILFAFKDLTTSNNVPIIVKGDGDQDRPNQN
tara:strand:- start:2187 stop:3224 length:1038 start_codon:yes stop_codon:yes gene_type:complete